MRSCLCGVSQPYRLRFEDATLSDVFYRESEVKLTQRGTRPFKGDRVVVIKAEDPRNGETAEVVVDDYDSQPYRLRFADGSVSEKYYRVEHVKLVTLPTGAQETLTGPELPDGGSPAASSLANHPSGTEPPEEGETPASSTPPPVALQSSTAYNAISWLQHALRRQVAVDRPPQALSEAIFAEMARVELAAE